MLLFALTGTIFLTMVRCLKRGTKTRTSAAANVYKRQITVIPAESRVEKKMMNVPIVYIYLFLYVGLQF